MKSSSRYQFQPTTVHIASILNIYICFLKSCPLFLLIQYNENLTDLRRRFADSLHCLQFHFHFHCSLSLFHSIVFSGNPVLTSTSLSLLAPTCYGLCRHACWSVSAKVQSTLLSLLWVLAVTLYAFTFPVVTDVT